MLAYRPKNSFNYTTLLCTNTNKKDDNPKIAVW